MGHFYTDEGLERFDATPSVAKKEGLLPSVTTYLDIIAKPGIIKWKENGLIEIAKRIDQNCSLEDYTRIVKNTFDEENNAAEKGTDVHDLIESMYKEDVPLVMVKDFVMAHGTALSKPLHASIRLAYDWFLKTAVTVDCEKTLVNKIDRYAGKCDASGMILDPFGNQVPGLIDWKTQGVKHPGFSKKDSSKMLKLKVNYYEQWQIQLGAYARIEHSQIGYIGIIGTDPKLPFFEPVFYDGVKLVEGFKTFKAIQAVYNFMNNIQ